MTAEIRHGRWQDVLADVECDALIVDAPYSERTHDAHGRDERAAAVLVDEVSGKRRANKVPTPITYARWGSEDIRAFVDHWAPRTRGWFVSITDHVLAPQWESALQAHGRYVFSPLAFVATGSRVRLAGDGPSQWACWIVVARPGRLHKWGTLPGAYVLPPGCNERQSRTAARSSRVVGGKPLWLMQSLVRDYTRPGDLVCDPCAGGGTTLLAARAEGRRAIGAEMDEAHYRLARARLARGFTPPLFVEDREPMQQLELAK